MNIKHIVLSGGGTIGFNEYGILRASHDAGFWNIENIVSIYGTSVGAIVGTMISLKLEWDLLDKFLIHRPWQKVFNIDITTLVNSFTNLGILNIHSIEDFFLPLFKAKEIPIHATMKEFYEITKIDLHIFTTELDNYEIVEISHTTHPEWKIMDAVYSSCSLPFLFSPHIKENHAYMDGGVKCNYPLSYCCNCYGKECFHEIFGIKTIAPDVSYNITSNSSLFDYVLKMIVTLIRKNSHEKNVDIPNEIVLNIPFVSIYDIYLTSKDIEKRKQLIEDGKKRWAEYYKKNNYLNYI